MPEQPLIDLAKLIVEHVRDRAISNMDGVLYGALERRGSATHWLPAIEVRDMKKLGEMIIADSVDSALFYLFFALDEGTIRLSYTAADGSMVNLNDGELAGCYGDWAMQFSQFPRYKKNIGFPPIIVPHEQDAFAQLIIEHVRDRAISNMTGVLHAALEGRGSAAHWRPAIEAKDMKKFGEMIIPDSVDSALFYLFFAPDEGTIQLSYTAADGTKMDFDENGELGGWYGEWAEEFTKERIHVAITKEEAEDFIQKLINKKDGTA